MRKLALADHPGREEVARRAAALGWCLADEFPADADCPYEAVWTLPESGAAVHYIEDDIVGGACFAFHSEASSGLQALLVEHFACRDLDAAIESAGQATEPASQIDAATAIALLAPDACDPLCQAAIAHLMTAADPLVRLRAMVAAASLGWREFLPRIKRMAADDPVDFVRWRAADTLEAFRRVHGNGRKSNGTDEST